MYHRQGKELDAFAKAGSYLLIRKDASAPSNAERDNLKVPQQNRTLILFYGGETVNGKELIQAFTQGTFSKAEKKTFISRPQRPNKLAVPG